MLTLTQAGLAAALAALTLCTPTPSAAALTSDEASVLSIRGEPMFHEGRSTLFLPHAVRELARAEPASVDDEARPFARIAGLTNKPFSIALRGPSDIALWNLIATVHAQQKNNVFDLMETTTTTVHELDPGPVSAVPLPGVVWLFVLGLMGLLGKRVPGGKRAWPWSPALAA